MNKLIFILLMFVASVSQGQSNFFWSHNGSIEPITPDIQDAQYICNIDVDSINADWRLTSISLSDNDTKLTATNLSTRYIYQWDISRMTDVCSVNTPDKSYQMISAINSAYANRFNSDGTKIYILNYATDKIYQYPLSTPYDITTFGTGSEITITISGVIVAGRCIYFKSDGTKMYFGEDSSDKIYEYDLSVAWDITTATYNSVNYDYSAIGTQTLWDISFNYDGTKLYLSPNSTTDVLYEADLSTAWDLSTAVYNGVFINTPVNTSYYWGFAFNADYTRLVILTQTGKLYLYKFN